jgi:phosphatidylinositol glycan class T
MPGLDRIRPHHIELALTLQPNTIYSIYFQAESAHLKWDEYPPDVNHGFYINPALITIQLTESLAKQLNLFTHFLTDTAHIRMYSETLLMNLPTPDFSMPYNVICLTCTVVAIGFGSMHNFTTRKFKFFDTKKTNLKQKLSKILSIFKKTKKD